MFFNLVILISVQHSVGGAYVYSKDNKCIENNVNATCVLLKDCPAALERVADKKEVLICSFKGIEPVVCCLEPKIETADKMSENQAQCVQKQPKVPESGGLNLLNSKSRSKNNPFTKCNEYRSRLLFPCVLNETSGVWEEQDYCKYPERADAGYRLSSGGAERLQFRHMALLLYGEGIQLDLFCGGSVISERYILTAAHCASAAWRGPAETVVTGILKLSDPQDLWRMNKVKQFIKYPLYKSPQKYYDIALIETAEEILLDVKVVPICLHSEFEVYGDLDDTEDVASATGWGALGRRQPFSDNLKNVRLTRSVSCSNVYGVHRNRIQGYDNETMLCYGREDDEQTDTCQGDSGGPLQVEVAPCQFLAIGVTSFGKNCATSSVPAVYTRVTYYYDWIQSIVWPDVNIK